MQQLKPEAIAKAREWFAANCEAQIAAIKDSLKTPEVFYCNDPHYHIARLEANAKEWRTGEVRMTFALWQRAYQYQTNRPAKVRVFYCLLVDRYRARAYSSLIGRTVWPISWS